MSPPGPLRRDGCPDMRYSCNRSWAASSGTTVPLTSGGVFSSINSNSSSSSLRHTALVENAPQRLRADGNPDMRYKANKEYVTNHGLVVPTTSNRNASTSVTSKDPTPIKSTQPITQQKASSGSASMFSSIYSDNSYYSYLPVANSTRYDDDSILKREKEEEKRIKKLAEERSHLEERNQRLEAENRRLEEKRQFYSLLESERHHRSTLEEEERNRSLLEKQKKILQAQHEESTLAQKINDLTEKLKGLQAAQISSTSSTSSRTKQTTSAAGNTSNSSATQKLPSTLLQEIQSFQSRMSGMKLKAREVSRKTIDTITGNYQQAIGRGGFSQVFKGEWNGRHVAVKDLRCSLRGTSKQFLKMVEGELLALSRLEHPSIVTLLAYSIQFHEPDIIAASLVFEYANGGTLFEHLFCQGTTPMDVKEIILIALNTAEAIVALHNLDLVHRDVKSSNILLQVKGTQIIRAVLADFGLARFSSELNNLDAPQSSLTAVVGTPGYVDPEYAESNQVLPRIDVYAFGVVLFEMLWREKAETQLARRVRLSTTEECNVKMRKCVIGNVDPALIRLGKRCVSMEDRPNATELMVSFFRVKWAKA